MVVLAPSWATSHVIEPPQGTEMVVAWSRAVVDSFSDSASWSSRDQLRLGDLGEAVDDCGERVESGCGGHVGGDASAGVVVAGVVEHAVDRPAQGAWAGLLPAGPSPDS